MLKLLYYFGFAVITVVIILICDKINDRIINLIKYM